ncbi:hypothetical protein [Alterinioella nitratireducens]|uniref:hypothetical protein n=1 Tax=Alterinioella nitratireducens TaxID=2735915 RepID=UPI001556BDC4|nr:hypothetical protein [Alterinioella nitratireducens]NPD21739.1 hypothetical protein [Alterinioella nitratireducens]
MDDAKSTCWTFLFSGLVFGAGLSSYYFTFDWEIIIGVVIMGGGGLLYGYSGLSSLNEALSREVKRNSEMRIQIKEALSSSDNFEEIKEKLSGITKA